MSPVCQLQMKLPGGFPGVSGVMVREMSDEELSRLEVLRDLDHASRLSSVQARYLTSATRCVTRTMPRASVAHRQRRKSEIQLERHWKDGLNGGNPITEAIVT